MKRAIIIWALIVACWYLAGNTQLGADIYTWTDAKGVRHYSNRPPSDANDPRVLFNEYQYDPNEDQRQFEMEQQEWKTLIEQIETDERQAAEESQRAAEQARKDREPSMAERAAAEQQRLQKVIADLEEKPLEYFGSYKNKRVRLGYYRYRLEALMQNPEEYFNNPQSFEGNVKETDQ